MLPNAAAAEEIGTVVTTPSRSINITDTDELEVHFSSWKPPWVGAELVFLTNVAP